MSIRRGIRPGFGLGATLPVRIVRDRIRFEDLARASYVPPEPDTHHRNETLVGIADPQIGALWTTAKRGWTLNASLGTSIPLGRTEANPFALGGLGLPHQHIQFGTGTWNPTLGAAAARSLGEFGIEAIASAKLSFYENDHGYRAGNRFGFGLMTHRKLGTTLGTNLGLVLDRENAETWDGRIEEEGNLGRTDLLLAAGFARPVGPAGFLGLQVRVPIRT